MPLKPAWIVIAPAEPPKDWGFKRDPKRRYFYRIVSSKTHATQLISDLNRLELNVLFPPKARPILRGNSPRKSVLTLWDKNQYRRILTLKRKSKTQASRA